VALAGPDGRRVEVARERLSARSRQHDVRVREHVAVEQRDVADAGRDLQRLVEGHRLILCLILVVEPHLRVLYGPERREPARLDVLRAGEVLDFLAPVGARLEPRDVLRRRLDFPMVHRNRPRPPGAKSLQSRREEKLI